MLENKDGRDAIQIFLSYSHKDEALREELEAHLSPLKRLNFINAWHDRKIMPGADYANEIDKYMKNSDLILLLISADFIASDYCYNAQLEEALQRHKAGKAWIIPVILRAVRWEHTPIGRLKPLPTDGKPITSWINQDEAFLDVVQGIERAILELARTYPMLHFNEAEQLRLHINVPPPAFSKAKLLEIKESPDGKQVRRCKLSLQRIYKQVSDINLHNIHTKDDKTLKKMFNDVRKTLKNMKSKDAIDALIYSIDQLYENIEEAFFYLEALYASFEDAILEIDKAKPDDINIEELKRIVNEFHTNLHDCHEYLGKSLQQFIS